MPRKSPKAPRSIARKVEIAVARHLISNGSFAKNECAIVEFSDSDDSPQHPSIVVQCVNVTRTDDTSADMYSKTANVVCALTVDSGQNALKQYGDIANELECWAEDLVSMQIQFNKPESGADKRWIQGLHLHYIDEFQTDSESNGTQWTFGVGFSLIMDEVAS
jgi:hypothetical protein